MWERVRVRGPPGITIEDPGPHRGGIRGDEQMGSTWNYLDITALGRQEEWEDSPEGYPQTPPYKWWNWHDNYDAEASPDPKWVDILTDPQAAARRRAEGAKASRRGESVTEDDFAASIIDSF